MGAHPELDLLTTSLHPGSSQAYARGHVRVLVNGRLRLQGSMNGMTWEEQTSPVSETLRTYVEALPHTCKSIANTETTYAPCQFRREGDYGKVRVQLAGPVLNRPWGAEFVLSCPARSKMPPGPAAITTTDPTTTTTKELEAGLVPPYDPAAMYAVADKVVIIKEGDGNGCGGGPKVGTVGAISYLSDNSTGCGPISFTYGSKVKSYWSLTAEHIAHVPKPAFEFAPDWKEKIAPLAGPTPPLAFKAHPTKMICANCGYSKGAHYPGGSGKPDGLPHYRPFLCPQDNVCPYCTGKGKVPLEIHLASVHPSKVKADPPFVGQVIADETVPF